MEMKEFFLSQAAHHPFTGAQDIIKQAYQAAFGAEHLITDEKRTEQYLEQEFAEMSPRELPLYEFIGPDAARVNMSEWDREGIPHSWLLRLFVLSAAENTGKDAKTKVDNFYSAVSQARELMKEGALPVDIDEFDSLYQRLFSQGLQPVHHSTVYHDNEAPAYRVVSGSYVRLLPLMEKLAALENMNVPCAVAIDGRAASGKTTVAKQLSCITGAGIVHMDDFFLPLELRTEKRLSEPGGNIDYSRFAQEVIPNLKSTQPFRYQRFECGDVMALGDMIDVPEGNIRIAEGSYSHHPLFGGYAALRIYSDITPQEQMERIIARNGKELAEMFRMRWIPMEENYFSAFQIKEKADIVI